MFQFRTHLIACFLIEVTLKTYVVASVLPAFSSDLSKTGILTAPTTLMTRKHLKIRATNVNASSRIWESALRMTDLCKSSSILCI